MLDQWALMASNGRNVCDMTKQDLEELVLEVHDELDFRSEKITKLKNSITQFQTQIKVVENSLRDLNGGYIKPPKLLRPDGALKYYYSKDASKEKEYSKESFKTKVIGSYNPYEAGNRRVVTLQHQIGDLQQKIIDITQETSKLSQEKDRIAKQLNMREQPKKEVFRHNRTDLKFAQSSQKIDARKCMQTLEQLIEREQNKDEKDYLMCCHMLLTGHDKTALQLFSALYAPEVDPEDIDRVNDAMVDREAQTTILLEQYRNLAERHKRIRAAYIDLQSRMENHVFDAETVISSLKEQIHDLETSIGTLPTINEETENLKKIKKEKKKELKKIMQDGKVIIDIEVKYKNTIADLKKEIAGKKIERAQLERLNQEKSALLESIKVKGESINEIVQDMLAKNDEIEGQKKVIKSKSDKLKRAHVKNPEDVYDIYEASQHYMPEYVYNERKSLDDEVKMKNNECKDLKQKCKNLKKILEDKTQNERQIRDFIQRIKDANKKRRKAQNESSYESYSSLSDSYNDSSSSSSSEKKRKEKKKDKKKKDKKKKDKKKQVYSFKLDSMHVHKSSKHKKSVYKNDSESDSSLLQSISKSKTKTETKSKLHSESDSESESESKSKQKQKLESESKSKSGTKSKLQLSFSESDSDSKSKQVSESKHKSESDSDSISKSESISKSKSASKQKSKSESESKSKPQTKPASESESESKSKSKSQSDSSTSSVDF